MRFPPYFAALALGCLIAVDVGVLSARPEGDWPHPIKAGRIDNPAINESSGLATSRRAPDLLWTHNDSDGQPTLYAIGTDGRYRGSIQINGASNYDWEDIASFTLDGHAYLIVADTGDNMENRSDCRLYVVAEPDPARLDPAHPLSVDIAWTIPVAYPGGPRDCENLAVDASENTVYLISKRTRPPMLYRLPLRPLQAPVVAVKLGPVNGILPTSKKLASIKAPWGRYRASPCAFDLSSDRRFAAVLTYGELYLYPRRNGQTWAEALAGRPLISTAHGLPQSEGACFSSDQSAVYVSTEGSPAPLLKYRVPRKVERHSR